MYYYPYHGSKAGKLRDRHYKAKSSEYLLADNEIILLARDILNKDEYLEAEELAKNWLVGKGVKKN